MSFTRAFSSPLIVLLSIAFLSVTSPTATANGSVVTVSGSAQRQVPPDIARITIAIELRGMELDSLRRQVGDSAQRVLRFLQPLRIAESDMDSSAISIRPEFSFERSSVRRFDGYVVARQFQITLRELSNLGAVIERSLDAGANQISEPVFDHSDRSTIERSVLALATADARSNAIAAAEGVGMTVGEPLKIVVNHEPLIARAGTMRVAAMESSATEASYQPGSLTFRVTVNAEFQLIAPGR